MGYLHGRTKRQNFIRISSFEYNLTPDWIRKWNTLTPDKIRSWNTLTCDRIRRWNKFSCDERNW